MFSHAGCRKAICFSDTIGTDSFQSKLRDIQLCKLTKSRRQMWKGITMPLLRQLFLSDYGNGLISPRLRLGPLRLRPEKVMEQILLEATSIDGQQGPTKGEFFLTNLIVSYKMLNGFTD